MEAALTTVLRALVGDALLAEKYRDHPLSGAWSGFAIATSSRTWC
jgi:mRNA-degrading endonuclease YafQ of YafQ-DinJ toxin-antitoxin module